MAVSSVVDLRSGQVAYPRMIATSLDCWLVSGHPSVLDHVASTLGQWSNVRCQAYAALQHLEEAQQEEGGMLWPDLLLLYDQDDWERSLAEFREVAGHGLTAVLLFSQQPDTALMRQALRAGVQDVLSLPCHEDELLEALAAVAAHKLQHGRLGRVSVFLNGKGGMGATFLATSVAHLLAKEKQERTVLVDADSQFGCCHYLLGVQPKFSLVDALAQVEELDDMALEGLLCKHDSGLRLIGSRTDQLGGSTPLAAQEFGLFLTKLRQHYDHVVVDLSRGVEVWNLPVLLEAHRLFMVVQQSLPALRDAALLLRQIRQATGIGNDKLRVIANRYSPRLDIGRDALSQPLGVDSVILVPNDFATANACANLGVPLTEAGRNKPLTRVLRGVVEELALQPSPPRTGLAGIWDRLRR